jgi:hypothetical protein
MEQAKLVGVGYLGKPDRVSRLLNKMVENVNPAYDIPIQGNFDNISLPEKESVTGFYFGFTRQILNLSLYIKPLGRHPGKIHDCITSPVVHKKDGLH